MKILYHHRIRSKDGQYVHIEEMIHALRAQGHDIMLVGPAAVSRVKFGSDAGLVVILKRFLPHALYEVMEFGYSIVAYIRLAMAVWAFKPDCLYERYNLFCPAGVWIKKTFKLPMLLEINAPMYEERRKYHGISLHGLAAWTQRYTWRGADRVLPVSHVLADIVRAVGVPDANITVIPNGINMERFGQAPDRDSTKQRLGVAGRIVLGFTGFVREWHKVEEIVDLMATELADLPLHLLIVGDGPSREPIEQRARELGIADRVTITGIVDRDELTHYMSAFDVALHPAVVAYASPLKLFEYLALGHVIVAPAQPNIEEILADGHNAIMFDPAKPETLCRAIRRACTDTELRARLMTASQQTIVTGGYTWIANAKRVSQLFASLFIGQAPAVALDQQPL
jgi:glycosyltransferase involved in cell wall biosynthesis